MSARDDYPWHAQFEAFNQHHPEARGALDEIDRLRRVAVAALAWKSCKYAMHGNTSDASTRHYETVRYAETNLRDKLTELLAEPAAGVPAQPATNWVMACVDCETTEDVHAHTNGSPWNTWLCRPCAAKRNADRVGDTSDAACEACNGTGAIMVDSMLLYGVHGGMVEQPCACPAGDALVAASRGDTSDSRPTP